LLFALALDQPNPVILRSDDGPFGVLIGLRRLIADSTLKAARVEAFVPTGTSRCFKLPPGPEIVDELPHQVLEPVWLKVF
jgi:hypothetical protein